MIGHLWIIPCCWFFYRLGRDAANLRLAGRRLSSGTRQGVVQGPSRGSVSRPAAEPLPNRGSASDLIRPATVGRTPQRVPSSAHDERRARAQLRPLTSAVLEVAPVSRPESLREELERLS